MLLFVCLIKHFVVYLNAFQQEIFQSEICIEKKGLQNNSNVNMIICSIDYDVIVFDIINSGFVLNDDVFLSGGQNIIDSKS